jgi:hypothetical protein
MTARRSGPGALARDEAGIECSERQFDTVSHTPQQSLSPESCCAVSHAQGRVARALSVLFAGDRAGAL